VVVFSVFRLLSYFCRAFIDISFCTEEDTLVKITFTIIIVIIIIIIVSQSVHFQPTRISEAMHPRAQLALLTLVTRREAASL